MIVDAIAMEIGFQSHASASQYLTLTAIRLLWLRVMLEPISVRDDLLYNTCMYCMLMILLKIEEAT